MCRCSVARAAATRIAFSADPVPDPRLGAAVPIVEANEYFEPEDQVRIENFSFGSIQIDGRTYAHDVVIDRGQICKRRKGASKRHRDSYGHRPLSAEETIPWRCRRLVIG